MTKKDGLVEFRLSEPALLFRREEDLDGDVFAAPLSLPHLPVPSFTDTLYQMDLLRYCSLNLERNKNNNDLLFKEG